MIKTIRLPDELTEADLELIEDVALKLAERMIELRRAIQGWAKRDADKTNTMFRMIDDR